MSSKVILACFLFLFAQYVSAYSVSGNKLLGPDGKEVRLRGSNKCSFEWSPVGEYATIAQYTLMKSWGANVIRLPLNQDFWLSGARTYASAYKTTIAQQVAWIKSLGMGVILDLHWSDQGNLQISKADQQVMADTNSLTFWKQVAAAYKDDPWVMFELYNEPHDVSWSIWQKGGYTQGFTAVGMQQMYDVIRQAGANNVVIICGLNWAYDLTGVRNGYGITGSNIAYATHAYDYDGKQKSNWESDFGYLAASYPIIMTEFGQYCKTGPYVADLMAYMESKGIHWIAWAWYPGGCSFPAVIEDWSGTPTAVGLIVKNAMASATAGGSTAAPYVTPAPTTKPGTGSTSAPVSGTVVVYDDSLQNGWLDYSWGTKNLANTNPTYVGARSIAFTLASYGGIYFYNPTASTVGSFSSIQFYTNGPNANVQVRLYGTSDPIGNPVSLPSSSSNGKWTLQTVPLSSLGVSSSTQFNGFAILFTQQSNGGVLYIDEVKLVAGSSTPSTSAPSTPTPSTSAPATQAPATSAPATQTPVTPAPPVTPSPSTQAPATSAPATQTPATPTPSTGSGCSAANVVITQTLATSYPSGGQTIYQYNVNIRNSCTTKTLKSFTASASGWNAINFWNLQASGSTITIPNYVNIGAGGSYTSAGYQNPGGQASFTVTSATFE